MNRLDILNSDPKLKAEIITRLETDDFPLAPSSPLKNANVRKFVISSLKKNISELTYEVKAIIHRSIDDVFIHPVLLIQDDMFLMPASDTIAQMLQKYRANIQTAIRASGRVERGINDFIGTAWVVAPKIVITCRHVANLFSSDQSVMINFKGEHSSNAASRFEVEKILYVSTDSNIDLAFLRVKERSQAGEFLPHPIKLSFESAINTDKAVCVIGYPARDGDHPDKEVIDRIFNSAENVKQLSTGQIEEENSDIIIHNCNTLPGNSGSVVFSYRYSNAVGIHYEGYDSNGFIKGKNFAVPASIIADRLSKIP